MRTDETERANLRAAEELGPPRLGSRLVAAAVALALAAGGIFLAVVALRPHELPGPAAQTLQANGPIALANGDPPRLTVVNADGTGLRELTTGAEVDPRAEQTGYSEESSPQWSPDGTQIAFVRWYDPGNSLCLLNADGSGFRILVPDLGGGQLAWSPDGTTFAYSSWRDHTIHLVDADGTNDRALPGLPQVLDGDPPNWLPAWSPDSTRVAFTGKDLWTIRTDGTGLTRLTDLPEGQFAFDASWSPDGSRIVFSVGGWEGGGNGGGGAQEGGRLYVVDADGSNLTPLSPEGQFWWAPDWSPDGGFVVADEATPPDSGDPSDWVSNGVYVMAPDGTGIHLLREGLWGRPVWGPAPNPSPSPTPSGGAPVASTITLPGGLTATRLAVGAGAVWALASTDQAMPSALVRIDPATSQVIATTPLEGQPWYVAASGQTVWVGDPRSSTIQRIDAATGDVAGGVELPGDDVTAMAADEQAVWVEVIQDRSDQGLQNLASLVRLDPGTDAVLATIPLDGMSGYDDEIAIGAGAVWVAGVNLTGASEERGADLVRIDPDTNSIAARLTVPAFSVHAGPGAVWVTLPADGVNDSLRSPEAWVAQRIDPATDEVSAPVPLPGNVTGLLAVTADGVWFSGYDEQGLIHPVRLQDGAYDASVIPIGSEYTDTALDPTTDTIWVAAVSGLYGIGVG